MNIGKITRHLTFLGQGVSRKVFALSDSSVLKVDIQAGGCFAGSCQVEGDTYVKFAHTDIGSLLAPVLDYADGWLVMMRAEKVGRLDLADYQHVKTRLNGIGIKDVRSANVGMVNGLVVATDYAYHSDDVDVLGNGMPGWVASMMPKAAGCEDCGSVHCHCNEMNFLPSRFVR